MTSSGSTSATARAAKSAERRAAGVARANGGRGGTGSAGGRGDGGDAGDGVTPARTRTEHARRARGTEPSTRDRILDHAVQIASREGLEALTIGRLASDLGMSKSGLFGHFGSKEELQLATIDRGADIFALTIMVPAMREETPRKRLAALVYNFIDYLEEATFEGGCFWGSVSAEFDNRPGPVRDSIQEKVGQWIEMLREQAEASGVENPVQTAFELHAIGQGANSFYQLFGDAAVFDRARNTIARILPS